MDNKYENLLPNSSGIDTAPSRNSSEQQGDTKGNIRFISTDSSKCQKDDSDCSGERPLIANQPLLLKVQSEQKKEKNSFQSTRQRRENAIYNTLSSASSVDLDKVPNKPFQRKNSVKGKIKMDLVKCGIAFLYTMTSLFFAGMAVNIANDRMNKNSQENPLGKSYLIS